MKTLELCVAGNGRNETLTFEMETTDNLYAACNHVISELRYSNCKKFSLRAYTSGKEELGFKFEDDNLTFKKAELSPSVDSIWEEYLMTEKNIKSVVNLNEYYFNSIKLNVEKTGKIGLAEAHLNTIKSLVKNINKNAESLVIDFIKKNFCKKED